MLEGDVDVLTDLLVLMNESEQGLVQEIGVSIKESNPLDLTHQDHFSQQTVESGSVLEISAVGREILSDEVYFFDAGLREAPGFFDDRSDRAASMRSAELRNNAKRALVIAALRNLEIGGVGGRRSKARRGVVVKITGKTDIKSPVCVGPMLS